MNYTAIVPARSGSKRLPHKNVKLLGGKPLVVWTLEACINASKVNRVIFSTDSMDYWNTVRQYIQSDKLVLDYRTPEEAGDTVKIFDYLKNSHDKIFADKDGAFILALPTVPLRTASHISEAIELFEQKNKPVFSATAYGFPVSFAFYLGDNGTWQPLSQDSPMLTGNTRSQNQREAYHPNGAIYVRKISDLLQPDLVTLYQNAVPYLMDRLASVDIDAEADFRIAEALMKNSI